jgi:hypothetical protein
MCPLTTDAATQVLLRLHYQALARGDPTALPELADVEFRCCSQNGEDGILLYLFSLLGATNRLAVELCAGDGIECNAANLIVNHGWQGLLIDADPALIERGRAFYAECKDTWIAPPTLVAAWVTAENVNDLVRENGFAGKLGLLSIDLDGNDYWIWRVLDCIDPHVVVTEFNSACGPEASIAIRYDSDFRLDFNVKPYRCGASLAAFAQLGREKGYRLVGVESVGVNAFFVRNGLAEQLIPERTPAECYKQAAVLRGWQPSRLEALIASGPEWVEV